MLVVLLAVMVVKLVLLVVLGSILAGAAGARKNTGGKSTSVGQWGLSKGAPRGAGAVRSSLG
jgi:hypothetical protein